jgi:DNA-binding transcriptional regulator/RsmH inhibitor MraZ
MDTQGRVLIHPLLRKSAQVVGDVAVLGYLSYLEVWELDRFQQRLLSDALYRKRTKRRLRD